MVFDLKPPKNVNVLKAIDSLIETAEETDLEIGIAECTRCPHHAIDQNPIRMPVWKFNRIL